MGGNEMLKRAVILGVFTAMLVAPAATAHGAPKSGGCPTAFQGPLDFATVIALYPPPEGVDAIAFLSGIDVNMNGTVCLRPLPNAALYNAIDDRLRPTE
jgi:hypothetical protein